MTLSPTPRSTLRRCRDRARHDRAELRALLDSALVCHLGLVLGGAPVVLPTGYGHDGDTLYLHGSTGAASLLAAAGGAPVCVTVTRLDGVVYARSAFHHSMNYASAVIHGTARKITDADEVRHGLRTLVEHLAPGSWAHSRQPTRKELAAVLVLGLSLEEASVKIRSGPPVDDEPDVAAARAWAGVLPLTTGWGTPIPCPLLPAHTQPPAHITHRPPLPAPPRPSTPDMETYRGGVRRDYGALG
ncbi:MAG TPA: pyridoxamine 5'-phosphate oxidase family protein [Pseudonocardiaceae bacterium]|nr:pyridoxamine 5'-phosphate oxidase family protein [Pseudonocardiaceae bacterium]